MKLSRLLAVTLSVAVIAAIVVALPAAAGGPGTPRLKGAKARQGPYRSEVSVHVESARSVFVKVKSTADFQQDATLSEQTVGDDADYNFKWFRRDLNISHDVQTSGFDFRLRAGAAKLFRVRVKPQVAGPDAVCLYGNVSVTNPTTGSNGPFFAINGQDACVP